MNMFSSKLKKQLLFKSVIFGLIAGLVNLLIIYLITNLDQIIYGEGSLFWGISFTLCIILYLLTNYLLLKSAAFLNNKIILDLRLEIQKYILNADFIVIEKNGLDSLFTINNDDITKVEKYAEAIPRLLINIFNVFVILSYTFIINWKETLLFIFLNIVSFCIFYFFKFFFEQEYVTSRNLMNEVTSNINAMIYGLRELRVNYTVRKNFIKRESIPTLNRYHEHQIKNNSIEQIIISWFWLSSYIILAICCYMLQEQHVLHKIKYILPIIMTFGPITMIMSLVGYYYSAKVALNKINDLKASEPNYIYKYEPLEKFELSNLSYTYQENCESNFKLGPINLTLNPGEALFITGGNGSGKSTLIKLITCLYYNYSGHIIYNKNPIQNINDRINYQNHLGVIYQNPYIFSSMLGVDLNMQNQRLDYYLNLFKLKNIVKIESGRILNLESLSYGQKKRCGLMISLLEDKDIYIFDEWAADQDTYFRKIFYFEIIEELKKLGKIVIAVTHDEEYFDKADLLLKLREGQQL